MFATFKGWNATSPSTSATNYGPVEGGNGAWVTAETSAEQVIPHALTHDHLIVNVAVAPGVGKSWQYTIFVNGVASALTCTISGAATQASDLTHSLSLSATDKVSLQVVPSGTPTAPGVTSWTTRQSATGKFAILCGTVNQQTAARFFPPQGTQNVSATESQVLAPCPIAGTISNMYCQVDAAPGGSGANAWIITLRKASANSALTVTLTDPATTGNDTTHSVVVAAGDLLDIGSTITGTPNTARFSISYTFTPTTDGDACWMHSNSSAPATGATNYDGVLGGSGGTWSTTETNRSHITSSVTAKALYVKASAAAGSAKSYVITVRKNGGATALTVTITGTSQTTGSLTGQSVTAVDGDLLAIESVPSGTPFTSNISTGIYYTYNGTTSVQQTLSPSYNIKQSIQKTATATFTIKNSVAKTVTAGSYTIRQAITKTVTPTYKIIQRIPKSVTASFNIHAFPNLLVAAAISGTPLSGQLLTASATFANDPVDAVTKTTQWRVETGPGTGVFVDIPGETGTTLQL